MNRRTAQTGYTYLVVLFLVAGMGLLMAGLGQTWQARAQREREAELIAVGVEMARAIARYRDEGPEAAKTYPESLEVLLEDRRFATPRRHLRRIYRDPITGKAEWGLVRIAGRISAVHSLSEKTPFKRDGLPAELGEDAIEAKTYQDWVFRPAVVEQAAAGVPAGESSGGPGGPLEQIRP